MAAPGGGSMLGSIGGRTMPCVGMGNMPRGGGRGPAMFIGIDEGGILKVPSSRLISGRIS